MHLTVGIEVTQRISEAYTWLCSVYNADPSVQTKIIFVGWSRGAFTALAVAGMVSRYGILRAKDGKYRTDEFTGLVDKFRATYFNQNIDKAGIVSKIQWSLEDTRLAVANHETLGKFLPADVEAYACWEIFGMCYNHPATVLGVMLAWPTLTVHALSRILRRTSIDLA